MPIERIKPSDISGWHGLLDILSKKRTLTQERPFAARLPGTMPIGRQAPIGHCTKPHTLWANKTDSMWEKLNVYKQLDKGDIKPTFKKFGNTLVSFLDGYSIDQTTSILKIFRQVNQLEQAIFIEKGNASYNLNVTTSIKPVDFYRRHKFTMLNNVPLGDILNNHRRTSFPLTQEWNDLAIYLATRIKTEVEDYFHNYNSYDKIIDRRKDIEPDNLGIDNKYELLIYAAIRTKKKDLLNLYLDKKMTRPVMGITRSEYLKPDSNEIDELSFLQRLKSFALTGDFTNIEKEIESVFRQN